jgi:hypothetical protein
MAIPADSVLRAKISDVIETNAPKAVVFSYWVLGFDQTTWPGLLRSALDLGPTGTKRVHGYVVTRRESTGVEKGINCVRRNYTYLIYGFHYYYSGPEADNSEKLMTAEVDLISTAFDLRQSLDPDIARIPTPISWTFGMGSVGGELLHIITGTLVLQPCDT